MYSYEWDEQTGGYILNTTPLEFSKEPRPVYYKELDILGFDKKWKYPKSDVYPLLWAESNNYYYRGRLVAKTKGGSIYHAPEIIFLDDPEPNGDELRFVDIPAMVEKNREILESLTQETIKKIYNIYLAYQKKVDIFYVAFSGGKDSIVTLDLVQRALPHNAFKVLFGDTGMEFPDTYEEVENIQNWCKDNCIEFLKTQSNKSPETTWEFFGPPAVTIRWCCSVHKTSPQIMLLQKQTGSRSFTGMAFTGVRGDESLSRSEYDDISFGNKHRGQYSCHPILEWNSAELFAYIYQEKLLLNNAYKKGNARVGCLVCPMSSGKHEFMKAQCFPKQVTKLINKIEETSSKGYNSSEMSDFIDAGNWKTRKTGRELNFGQDCHIIDVEKGKTIITVFKHNDTWKQWVKTIGNFVELGDNKFTIEYQNKPYFVVQQIDSDKCIYTLPNCGTTKDDIKFISLFKSVIIKSLYCVKCGVCTANCSVGCIDMSDEVRISDKCIHCYQCHDIPEHCLRYNSIRNKIRGEHKMVGLDRYFSFGIRKQWLDIYFKYKGTDDFWIFDGDGVVANKKKDAFLNFVKDAGLVVYNKAKVGDKYTKNEPNYFAKILFEKGSDSEVTWAMLLCNLVYTPEFKWFIKNIGPNETYTPDQIKFMLEGIMENDSKGLGRRNIVDALKMFLVKTPFGAEIGLGDCEYQEKVSTSGVETITLNSFRRSSWKNPEPKVILYSLYKFSEACGDYKQFTLTRLLNHEIESDGISPTQIFGLDRKTMERILSGLANNYPDFISVSFTLDLDNINLKDKTSEDVLSLFDGE